MEYSQAFENMQVIISKLRVLSPVEFLFSEQHLNEHPIYLCHHYSS